MASLEFSNSISLGTGGGVFGYPTVDTYADLALLSPQPATGSIYAVLNTTGFTLLFNKKKAGLYQKESDGTWRFYSSSVGIHPWDAGRTYAQYELCTGSTGIIYKSEIASNLNNNPDTNDGTSWSSSVDFSLVQTAIAMPEGRVAWDPDAGTVQVGMPGGNVKLQVGQEMHLPNRPKNIEGTQINNGQVVYGDSATGSVPEVQLAIASDPYSARRSIAVATEDVADQQRGFYTTSGVVRDFDTSHLAVGQPAYLDPTTKGALTNTRPQAPNVPIVIGVCLRSHATEGAFFVEIVRNETEFQSDITMEPTGFSNPENVVVSYDSTTRKVTLTGTVVAYYKGRQVEVLTSGWVSDAHADTTGSWFLFYNGTSFVWQQTPWTFDTIQIAYVYYGASDKFALRECHGLMQWQGHQEAHDVIGTYKKSGGTLSNYTLSSTTLKQPDVSSTVVKDEDIESTVPSLTGGNYTHAYLTGSGTFAFSKANAQIMPVSGNQPYYNQFTGGTWQQTLMSNNYYANSWIIAVPATADSESQAYRYLCLQPQRQFLTLSGAQGETVNDLTLGDLQEIFTEFVFINKVTDQYTASNWSIKEVNALTGSKVIQSASPSGTFLSVVETDATLTGLGTSSSALGINLTNANTWTGAQKINKVSTTKQSFTPTGTTQTIDWASGSKATITTTSATGAITLTLNNPTDTESYWVEVVQGLTPRNIIFPSGSLQSGVNTGNTIVGVASATQHILVLYDGTKYLLNPIEFA